ncbi:hypothetical protein D3C78_1713820 [compost metagenome]
MAFQVGGGGANQQLLRGQGARHQRRVLQRPDTHRHVVPVFHQVHHAVVQIQVDHDVGIALQIFRNGGPQMQNAERHRRADPKAAAGALALGL